MRLPTPREPRVQHEPDAVRLVEADLDEVVAGAERAEVVDVRCRAPMRGMLRGDRARSRARARAPRRARPRRQVVPRAAIVRGRRCRCGRAAPRARSRARSRGRIVGQVARARGSSAPPSSRSRCRRRPPRARSPPSSGSRCRRSRRCPVDVRHHARRGDGRTAGARRAAAARGPVLERHRAVTVPDQRGDTHVGGLEDAHGPTLAQEVREKSSLQRMCSTRAVSGVPIATTSETAAANET